MIVKANVSTTQKVSSNTQTSSNVNASSKEVLPITRNYSGEENDLANVIVDNNKSTIEVIIKPHSYASRFDFPNIGNKAVLYIDENENKNYRWSDSELKYYCVGSDYTDIKVINGGTANGECNA